MEKYTYQKEVTESGWEYIKRSDDAFIPIDPANSDYQAYLESLEPKAKAPKVVDEAAPE